MSRFVSLPKEAGFVHGSSSALDSSVRIILHGPYLSWLSDRCCWNVFCWQSLVWRCTQSQCKHCRCWAGVHCDAWHPHKDCQILTCCFVESCCLSYGCGQRLLNVNFTDQRTLHLFSLQSLESISRSWDGNQVHPLQFEISISTYAPLSQLSVFHSWSKYLPFFKSFKSHLRLSKGGK
jgi:hypothetical protein